MIPNLTALLSTVAGKAAVGVVVATTSVGAAVAAAGAEIPFVAPVPPPAEMSPVVEEPVVEEPVVEEPVVELPAGAPSGDELVTNEIDDAGEAGRPDPTHGDTVSAFTQSTELEGCEKGQATAAVARGDVVLGEDGTIAEGELALYLEKCQGDDPETEETEEAEDPSDQHGAVVSTFATETELEGCERGQAVAAVARGDVVPGEAGTVDEEAVTPYLEKCRGEEAPDAAETQTDEADETDADSAGPPAHAGKPDKPGKPDHAGPPAGKGPNG